ncbi:MAG: RnfABCDGE type electron transport complex subunit B, partial [Anaerovorax sp.]
MERYIIPIVIVVGIGLVAGVILTLAAKFMAVKENELAKKVRDVLPGANCGACGYPGCDEYAKVIAEDHTVKPNLCTPGGSVVAKEISEVLGIDFESVEGKIAILKCAGSREKTNYVMDYQGFQSCSANKLFYNGRGACDKGCLGFGDCALVCDYDAITVENGIAVIDKNRCIGCGVCMKVCPNQLIELVPSDTRVMLRCSSHEGAGDTRKKCKIGCV